MGYSPDTQRRLLGAVCLTVATLMLALGLTVLRTRLQGEVFVCYWLACTLFTGLTMIIALLDLRAVRHRSQEEHEALAKNILKEFAPRDKDAKDE